jgi:peroxiredoxin
MVATACGWIPAHASRVMALALCFLFSVTVGCNRPGTSDPETNGPTDDSASNTTAVTPAPAITSDESGSETENIAADQEASLSRDGDGQPGTGRHVAQPQDATTESAVRNDSTLPGESTEPSEPDDAVAAVAPEPPVADESAQPAAALMDWDTWEPIVHMSQSHASTCLVTVGDMLPSVEMSDLDGTSHQLADLLGSRLTVVVFWDSKLAYAREQYEQLVREVVEPFGSLGVTVVAINVGDDPDAVRDMAAASLGKFVNLLDAQRSVYQVVGTEKLPRTFLLDASGKVLWLDIEYSRGTRRELENALRYYLKLDS